MILPIYIYGHPVLRKKAEPIDKNYPNLKELINDLFETMKKEGVGIAAPQIGKSIRLFVINGDSISKEKSEMKGFTKVFINAEIIEMAGNQISGEEGCLSVPEIWESVVRNSKIRVKYLDENFVEIDEWLEGFKAIVFQHEYDHIEGKLMVDRYSALKRSILSSKLKRISKGNFERKYKVVISD